MISRYYTAKVRPRHGRLAAAVCAAVLAGGFVPHFDAQEAESPALRYERAQAFARSGSLGERRSARRRSG